MTGNNRDDDITVPNIFAGDPSGPAGPADDRAAQQPSYPPPPPYQPQPGYPAAPPPPAPGTQPYPGQPYSGEPYSAEYPAGPGYLDSGDEALVPGWEPAHPAETSALVASPRRSRAAILGVAGVVLATVAVIVIALLVAPSWNNSSDQAPPPPSAPTSPTGPTAFSVASSTEPTAPSTDPAPSTEASPPPTSSAAQSVEPTTTAQASATTTAGTTTVGTTSGSPTATTTTTATAAGSGTAPGSGTAATTASPKPTTKATPTAKATPTTKSSPPKTVTSIPPINPLGVPEKQISCSNGYVVQLASELDRATFAQRVAALKQSGQLPSGAQAADSTKSCKIFTNQTNTLVLWSGPYANPYDGCAARLAGPYDAFIKGASPDTAQKYISCLCPANTNALPKISKSSDPSAWIGELQRTLGGRLNISVGSLGPNEWGHYTDGTRAAVVKFQQSKKLPANGVVNAKTWRALQSAGC
jgi:hypothetical protein